MEIYNLWPFKLLKTPFCQGTSTKRHNTPINKEEKQIISGENQNLLQKEVLHPCMR